MTDTPRVAWLQLGATVVLFGLAWPMLGTALVIDGMAIVIFDRSR
jgi:hypothetical protein